MSNKIVELKIKIIIVIGEQSYRGFGVLGFWGFGGPELPKNIELIPENKF